jgi:hypothetical protein
MFLEPSDEAVEIGAMAIALHAFSRDASPRDRNDAEPPSRWKLEARREALQ